MKTTENIIMNVFLILAVFQLMWSKNIIEGEIKLLGRPKVVFEEQEGQTKNANKDISGDGSTYSIHMADHGTDEEQKETTFYHATRENRYLLYLEEALERIESGTYGICKGCGKEIPKERLEAVPHTQLCVPCKLKEKQS